MGAKPDGISLNNQGQAVPGAAAPRLLAECRVRTLEYAGHLPALLCAALEKALAERSADDFSNGDDQTLIGGLRAILRHKPELGEVFAGRFAHYFDLSADPSAGERPAAGSDGAALSLVDDSELEESLAVTTLTGRLQERYSDELFGLGQRYGQLLTSVPVERSRLPMGPDNFCNALRDAMAALAVEPGVRLLCYRQFERVLLSGLGDLYAGLNGFLTGQGVLPQLKVTIRAQPSASRTAAGTARRAAARGAGGGRAAGSRAQPAPDDGFFGETVPQIQEQVFQAMQTLLGAPMPPVAATPSGIATTGAVYLPATPMLVDTLSSLQHDPALIERSGELLRGGLKQHVVGRFETMDSTGRPGVINQIDDETIDVISMIFDYILDDRTLPDFVKALIGRLQIPVLKVAIVDRGFFTDKQHPVRQLLNELAYAGVGWIEEGEAAKDRLYEKMDATVRRILDEFDHDVKFFASILEDFRGFLDEEKTAFALARERLGIEAQETAQIEQVKIRVAEEIAARLVNRTVPDEVREFLTTSWRQLLLAIHLEEGEDSPARARALQVMDDLLWSLEPKTTADQRRRLGVLLPILLEELREGQARIGRGDADIQTFAAVLERHHFTSLKASRPREDRGAAAVRQASVDVPAPERARLDEIDRMIRDLSSDIGRLPEVDIQDLTNFDDLIERKDPQRQGSFEKMMAEMGFAAESDGGPRIEDKHTALVRSLELGAWVELSEADGRRLRVKLAWVGDAYTNFSFVNRQYKVVAERPLYVLAEEFRTGAARLIEDVGLFDRALDGVISGIMKFSRPRTGP